MDTLLNSSFLSAQQRVKSVQLVVLLVLSFILTVILNSEWIYNVIGFLDPWGYLGAMFNPIHMRRVYPEHPIGDLLPLTLSGGIFYEVFSPTLANYFYKMACFVSVGFFMFRALENEFGSRTALFGTTAFLSSKELLACIGNDYTEGRVVIFLMVALYFILRAVDLEIHRQRLFLFLAGFAFALSVSTALLSMAYAPALAVLFFGKNRLNSGRFELVHLKNSLFCILGFFSCVLLLCAINFFYTGHFIYFSNTIVKAQHFLTIERAAAVISLDWDWLALPLYGLAGALSIFVFGTFKSEDFFLFRKRILLLGIALITNFLFLGYLQLYRHQSAISDPYYFRQTLPLTFLTASGVFFAPWLNRISHSAFVKSSMAFLVLSFFAFWYTTTYHQRGIFFHDFTILRGAVFLAIFFLVSMAGQKLIPVGIMASFFFLFNLSPEATDHIHKTTHLSKLIPSRKLAHTMAIQWVELMNRLDPERKAYLWYQRSANRHWVDLSAASHYWQGRLYNEKFPSVGLPTGENNVVVNPDQLVKQPLIIMSPNHDLVLESQKNLLSINIRSTCSKGTDFIVEGKKYFEVYQCTCEHVDSVLHASNTRTMRSTANKISSSE